MSETLEVRAEILKLARLLRRSPDDLEYLQEVSSNEIRALREQITEVLFSAHGPALSRLAAGSRVLPVALVATLGQRVFGPVLSARIVGLLEPGRAVEMAARLPVGFLADVAVEMDPRRASAVISRIPPAQIAAITRELVEREEYVTMGRFVGHLHDDAITAAVAAMDDRSLLHVAFVFESKERLRAVIDVLPPGRLDGIVDAAASANLWPEVLDLLGHFTDEQRAEFVRRASAWDDGRILEALLQSARQQAMWGELLPLVPLLPADGRQRVVAIVGSLELEDGAVQQIATAVIEHDLWDAVLTLAPDMPDDELQRVTARLAEPVAAMDPAERDVIVARARAAGLMERLGPLSAALLDGR